MGKTTLRFQEADASCESVAEPTRRSNKIQKHKKRVRFLTPHDSKQGRRSGASKPNKRHIEVCVPKFYELQCKELSNALGFLCVATISPNA